MGTKLQGAQLLLAIILLHASRQAQSSVEMTVQYTTNGDVKLNILNISFHTVQLHVKLLGCDYGYYDTYLLSPPTPSWRTQVTPFHCVECECEVFENERTEQFVAL